MKKIILLATIVLVGIPTITGATTLPGKWGFADGDYAGLYESHSVSNGQLAIKCKLKPPFRCFDALDGVVTIVDMMQSGETNDNPVIYTAESIE